MKLGLYSAYDKVANRSICCFASASDGLAVRENAPALSKVIPLGDVELRRIASVDDTTLQVSLNVDTPDGQNFSVVPWDSYKFPESPIEREAAK